MKSHLRLLFCIFCMGMLALGSCKDKKLYRQLEEFSRSRIVIPENIPYLESSGQLPADYDKCAALMVVYVDSIECATCRMKSLYEYDAIINFATDSISGFVPAFIFAPRKNQITEVRRTLEVSGLNYPALLDESEAFAKANPHIPADSRFHTFLLDKNGKVVLVGDPSRNPALWELYKTTITKLIDNGGILPE